MKVVCYLPESLPANHSGTSLPLAGVRALFAIQVVGVVNLLHEHTELSVFMGERFWAVRFKMSKGHE